MQIRFGKWEEILNEPIPDEKVYAVCNLMARYARGTRNAKRHRNSMMLQKLHDFTIVLKRVHAYHLIFLSHTEIQSSLFAGIAFASTNRVAEAEAEQKLMVAQSTNDALKGRVLHNNPIVADSGPALFPVAREMLAGEVRRRRDCS